MRGAGAIRVLTVCVVALLALAAPRAGAGPEARAQGEPPRTDLCPGTSRVAAPLAFGCTAIQLVRRPEVFVVPLLETLDVDEAMLEREPAFGEALPQIAQARKTFERAAGELERGTLCLAARTAARGAHDVADALALLDAVIEARAVEVAATRTRSAEGDVEQDDLQLASWNLQKALVARAGADAREAAAAFDATCAAIAGLLDVRGTVAANDDAEGLVELTDGTVFGLAAERYPTPAAPGTEISASGLLFNDGTGLATTVKGESAKAKFGPAPCALLRIAPIQPMPPFHFGPVTLHQPRAYEDDADVLQLEQGMRLGAVDGSCPGATPEGHALHYGLTIDVDQSPLHETVATDLREGNAPVGLPGFLGTQPAKVTATVFRTECTILGPDFEACKPPEGLSSTEYTVVVRALGSYATVLYNKIAFSVTDDGEAGDFEPATPIGAFSLIVPGSTNPTFSAEGYKITGGVSSRPQVAPIVAGDTFAVYSDDFFDPGYLFTVDEVLATGQERPSALRWARLNGTRNNAPFWYSAKLPSIQHDRVAACPTLPSVVIPMGNPNPNGTPGYPTYPPAAPYTTQTVKDSYYKLPFAYGFAFGTGTNGNIDDPNETRRHPEWQAYALDLGAPDGMPLRAARGGEVVFVEESDPYNLWNPTPPGGTAAPVGWTGIGNYFFIRHEDGTYAVYFHVQEDSVIPGIGSHVRRGQHVADVGLTGNASGPHVHFGVATNETHNKSPFVHRVRYEAALADGVDSCYIPRSTDAYSSTNEAPTPD